MPVTIKDIAKIAGVSHTTVSRALRDHPAIAPETIRRIKQIAAEQGYLPSAVARGLKTSHSRTVGVIVSSIDNPFWSEVLQEIDDVLHPAGYSLFVVASHLDKLREKEIVRAMVERRVDGVLLCSPNFSVDQGHLMSEYGLPVAVVNNQGAEDFLYSIYNDNDYGSRLVTQHLISLGHRRIAYLGSAQGGRTTVEREQGYRAEMKTASLPIDEALVHAGRQGTPAGGYDGAGYFLSLAELPTAIFCFNDYMAIGVYSALYQAGVRIPQDISVVGFDNIAISAYLTPPLTTFHQPKDKLGAEAARLMLYLFEPRPGGAQMPEPQKIVLRGELCLRASTQPLARSAPTPALEEHQR
jgi:DNA-binding LacI/PurR family transcriptional regulator